MYVLRSISLLLLIFVFTPLTEGRVLCPRVISEHNADVSDWKRFREYHAWKDKTGQELAIAVWQYLCDYETGLYHFNEILEGTDPFNEYATVRDPMKILNIYNMAYCGIFGPVLDGIFQNIGFQEGRSFGIDLWNHCATEIRYGDEWHYYDLDVRGILLDEHGDVISLDEAKTNRRYWTDPPIPIQPFFPTDPDKNKVFEIYRDSHVNYYYRWFEGSHTMDFSLRQGESFTRWWAPQGGRWNHRSRYNQTPWLKKLILTDPIGMKPNHRDFTRWNHGNGLFHYEPNLTNQSTDFEDGVTSSLNLTPGEYGLECIQDGAAEALFEVFTPYIIVAKINDLDKEDDDTEASQISLHASVDIEVFLSLDHGKSWTSAGMIQAGHNEMIDLTQWVKGTYGYQLKLKMQGGKGQPTIQSMKIDTWTQVAPISLPRLKKGTNHISFQTGDRYNMMTEPILITPNTADPEDLKKYVTAMPSDYDPTRHTSRIQGDIILHLKASANKKIAWFSAGATFRTHQGEGAKQTDNRIAYAIGQPENFQEIYKSSIPEWTNHWRCNWDTDVRLDTPASDVYVKFTGNPAVNVIRACMHVYPTNPTKQHLSITHGFTMESRLHTQTIELDQPQNYTIECNSEPENVFIKMAVPSDRK